MSNAWWVICDEYSKITQRAKNMHNANKGQLDKFTLWEHSVRFLDTLR